MPLKSIHGPLGVVNPSLRTGGLIFVFLLYPFLSYFHQPLLSRVHFVSCMTTSLLQYRSDNLKCGSWDSATWCTGLLPWPLLCGFEVFTPVWLRMPFLRDMTLLTDVSNMFSGIFFKGQEFHEEMQPAYGADTDTEHSPLSVKFCCLVSL